MSKVTNEATSVVAAKLEELLQAATTESVRVKLRNISDTCEHLVVTGKQRLTVPSLLAAYAARHPAKDQSIAESSIRNNRPGGNPYRELYRSWESVAEVLLAAAPRSAKTLAGEIMDYDDLAGIADLTVRHQVQLLVTQNKSLKSQVDILKQVRGAPVLRLQATHPESRTDTSLAADALVLSSSEIAALVDFMTPKRMAARGLVLGGDGVLQARGGKELSDPGFIDALQKVLDHVSSDA